METHPFWMQYMRRSTIGDLPQNTQIPETFGLSPVRNHNSLYEIEQQNAEKLQRITCVILPVFAPSHKIALNRCPIKYARLGKDRRP